MVSANVKQTGDIPPTLTARLPGGAQLDAGAGLVHNGSGRFDDAALGLCSLFKLASRFIQVD